MKPAVRQHLRTSIEILEARIAPAAIFTFIDTDGDNVTVSSTKGTNADLAATIQPFLSASGSGFQLQQIALNTAPAIFQGTTLVIFASPVTGGDGFVDVGYINATGLDLNSVTVDGDLGQIDAGDANVKTTALKSLSAVSLGERGLATQAAGGSLVSTIFGGVGALVLGGNLRDATFEVLGSAIDPEPLVHSNLDAAAKIGAVKIDGSVLGGADAGSGQIFAKGRIGTIEVGGSIVGDTGVESGRVWAEGGIGTATIEGSIIGGTDPGATASGQLFAGGKTTKIVVKGKLIGGAAEDSGLISNGRGLGTVIIGEGIEGGAGDRSGTVASAAKINTVTIEAGGVTGGSGAESGVIRSTGAMQTVKITGDLRGDEGDRSGVIGSVDTIVSVTIDGSVIGGSGQQSGALGSLGSLGKVHVTGDLEGRVGDRSGQVVSTTTIGRVTVDGSVFGGAGVQSGAIGSFGGLGPIVIGGNLVAGSGPFSGFIVAAAEDPEGETTASIARVTIGGNIDGNSPIGSTGFNAASILTDGPLGPVEIGGNVDGGETVAENVATIVGETIASVLIKGSLLGGEGESSGAILANAALGPVTIRSNVTGDTGDFSGSILSAGSMGAVTIGGALTGGSGRSSGIVETQGDPADSTMGAVKITGAIVGGAGVNSGSIHSSGKLVSVKAAELLGYTGTAGRAVGLGSGSISSELEMGPVNIVGSIIGGSGDESGKITSGGKLTSLTVGGSLSGGSGSFDTTAGDLDQIGQVFAAGALGPVKITQHLNGGGGDHSGEIRAASIKSVFIGDYVEGGSGASSGGLVSTVGDIGPVTIVSSFDAGLATLSGFVTAADRLISLRTEAFVSETGQRIRISATNEIKTIVVTESVEFTDIIAGMDIEGNFVNPAARIGSVTIGTGTSGFVRAMNIVAGAEPGDDGEFGTSDDAPISTDGSPHGISKIASVIINGSILDEIEVFESPGGIIIPSETFGIVAEHVVRVRVGTQNILQQTGPRNDFKPIDDSALFINEMPLD